MEEKKKKVGLITLSLERERKRLGTTSIHSFSNLRSLRISQRKASRESSTKMPFPRMTATRLSTGSPVSGKPFSGKGSTTHMQTGEGKSQMMRSFRLFRTFTSGPSSCPTTCFWQTEKSSITSRTPLNTSDTESSCFVQRSVHTVPVWKGGTIYFWGKALCRVT